MYVSVGHFSYNQQSESSILLDLHFSYNRLLTGTFFCVTTTAESLPRIATDVNPP